MTPMLHRRLDALEQRAAITATRWRRVICRTEAEADAARASAKPGEGLIVRMIVQPGADDGRG
jgi:hypothetical protein